MASLSRMASVAGLVTLLSIVAFEVVLPSAIVGATPLSGTVDRAAVAAWYDHRGLEVLLGLGLFVVVLPAFVVFAVTIRELSIDDRRARYLASLGSAFALAAVPVYILKSAIAAALVGIVASGSDPVPLFRVYDLAYNGAIYPLEAAYVLCLGLAVVTLGGGAWLRWLSVGVATLQLLASFVLFLGVPSAVTLPGNLAFAAWLGAMSLAVWRLEPVRRAQPMVAPA
jgi:hypothetical protein